MRALTKGWHCSRCCCRCFAGTSVQLLFAAAVVAAAVAVAVAVAVASCCCCISCCFVVFCFGFAFVFVVVLHASFNKRLTSWPLLCPSQKCITFFLCFFRFLPPKHACHKKHERQYKQQQHNQQ